MAFLKEKIELEAEELQLGLRTSFSGFSAATKSFLIFCLIAFIPAYYVSKTVSQTYWHGVYSSYNFKARESFTAPKSLKVGSIYITSSNPTTWAIAANITNENVDLAIESVPVEIKAYNANRQEIGSVKDTFYILPNQSRFVVAPKIITHEPIDSAEVIFPKELPWKRDLSILSVPLQTGQASLSNQVSPIAFTVETYVENKSPYSLGKVTVVFLLSDASGAVVGVSQRNEFTLSPFERRSIKQLWPGVYNTNVVKATILAYTNPLDSANVKAGTQNSPAAGLGKPQKNPYGQ